MNPDNLNTIQTITVLIHDVTRDNQIHLWRKRNSMQTQHSKSKTTYNILTYFTIEIAWRVLDLSYDNCMKCRKSFQFSFCLLVCLFVCFLACFKRSKSHYANKLLAKLKPKLFSQRNRTLSGSKISYNLLSYTQLFSYRLNNRVAS